MVPGSSTLARAAVLLVEKAAKLNLPPVVDLWSCVMISRGPWAISAGLHNCEIFDVAPKASLPVVTSQFALDVRKAACVEV